MPVEWKNSVDSLIKGPRTSDAKHPERQHLRYRQRYDPHHSNESRLNNISFLRLPERIRGLINDGATIVTATHRLAREYRQQYDLAQMHEGKLVWETVDILPLGAWVTRCWQRARVHDTNPATLIDDLQINTIWEEIIQDDINRFAGDDELLWNVSPTAKAAMDAWKLAMNWDIHLRSCETSFQADHQSFGRWANQFKLICKKNNWLDSPSLINEILRIVEDSVPYQTNHKIDHQRSFLSEQKVAFIGFDRITPQQQRFIDHLNGVSAKPPPQSNRQEEPKDTPWEEIRAVVLETEPLRGDKLMEAREYSDEYEEWLSAAHWAREKLTQNPDQRIAIVVPDLNQCREKIDHALSQILCPNQLIEGGAASNRPYHLSLGQPISAYPVIKAANILLRLMVNRVSPYNTFASLLLSPFISAAKDELFRRSRLEMWTRRQLPFECTLTQFIQTIRQADDSMHCPQLIETLTGLQELLSATDPTQTFSFWEITFRKNLELAGWPGQITLNSDEFQTVDAFFGHLKALTAIDAVGNHVTAGKALAILEQRLAEQTFQPETGHTSLEVLGVLEATGIRFDAMWFGGLTEKNWPPPLRSSPFIPRSQQELAGFHQSAVTLNREFANTVQNRLVNDSQEIVFSRPRYEQDLALQVSPLFPLELVDDTQWRPLSLIQQISHLGVNGNLETVTESSGLPVSMHQLKGGTSIIQDQSHCPWRAYSRHRLGAREDNPNAQGLDAMNRGSIIHGALELMWQNTRSLANLRSMTEEARHQLVNRSVHIASQRFAFISGCGPQFLKSQSAWLQRILKTWLEVELSRTDNFDILELEKTQILKLGELELRFKVDRIDRLEDGSLVLIDYKTGHPISLNQWMGERPESPQLPLYAIAQMEPIEAITFAHVNSGNTGYYGVSHESKFLGTTGQDNKPSQDTSLRPASRIGPLDSHRTLNKLTSGWEEMLTTWYHNLNALAEQFVQGDAKVDPLNALTCARCDLHSFCRIHEKQEMADQQEPLVTGEVK